jgi:Immunity protein 27
MMKLKSNETELQGSWDIEGDSIYADEVCVRIENLITNYLTKIIEDESGWNKLYQDPDDKRFWELSYPESDRHGGGAPLLKNLSLNEVKEKYKIVS